MVTVNENLGRFATGAIARAGFDRMVEEVCLGKVGVAAARKVSRRSRASRGTCQSGEPASRSSSARAMAAPMRSAAASVSRSPTWA